LYTIQIQLAIFGSLEDLLSNDNVKLGWDFKFSLLKDICRGMHFLHLSEIQSHGRLKSSNCLVDNRWTCKISGFGLPSLRYNGPRKKLPDDDEFTEKKLTFGIILTEICTREEPYSSETGYLEPEQILQLVIDKDSPTAGEAK
ncbi:natriuretic 1-like peptide receptor, partial [Mytilus galloprovincialis]